MKENTLPTNFTIDLENLIGGVITSWDKSRLKVDHLMHGNWVAYFKTWRRRSLFSGSAQTCGNQSNVWNSRRLLRVIPKFETKNPSLGYICPGEPHERRPNAPKFEDRSQEETEWPEQGAREAAWKLAKNVLKLKEHERATFFSPSENWCLLVSTLKPEEREFVVDSGASMHMISKKDLSDAEMDTLTKSCSPTIVITANGEVQNAWRGNGVCQRIGYILDFESPRKHASSIIARKALRWKRVLLRLDQWSKTTSHYRRDSDNLQYGELRTYCGSRLVKFVLWIFINLKDTFETGESFPIIFLLSHFLHLQ